MGGVSPYPHLLTAAVRGRRPLRPITCAASGPGPRRGRTARLPRWSGHGGPVGRTPSGAAATGLELARGRPTRRRPPLTQTFHGSARRCPRGASGSLHPVRVPAIAVGCPVAVGDKIGSSMLDSAAEVPPATRFESPQMRVGSGGASSMPPQQRNSIEINAPGEWKP